MKCRIEDKSGKFLRYEEVEPNCGEDFCDSCGDCLSCYAGDDCLENERGDHLFILSEEELAQRQKEAIEDAR